MRVRARLARLEKSIGDGPCPACGATGGVFDLRTALAAGTAQLCPMVFGGEEPGEPEPPCPRCGAEPFRFGPMTFDGGKEAIA